MFISKRYSNVLIVSFYYLHVHNRQYYRVSAKSFLHASQMEKKTIAMSPRRGQVVSHSAMVLVALRRVQLGRTLHGLVGTSVIEERWSSLGLYYRRAFL